ncbi:MAG: LysM peptidoglycan-binding domain-containing protein, partial [Candidatus Doudnabacteria bacterium]|nr:LysM peptidoglycan-binding domain-containing protein [Candidatus Doudnabacteria bacterium]
ASGLPSLVEMPFPFRRLLHLVHTLFQKGDTLRKIAARVNSTVNDILAVNPQITDANRIYAGQVINLPTGATYYTVQSGDTMKKIAARFGTTLESLIALNPQITNINTIYVGQTVRIW